MDLSTARLNMVKTQLETWGVNDDRILDLYTRIPREDFVLDEYKDLAYADMDLPIGHGEIMLPPKSEARMLQALNIRPDESVLEIGTGSGFFTLLLAKLAKRVHTVDIHDDLVSQAQARLKKQRIQNVKFYTGDASHGWDQAGQVDVVVITGSLPLLPKGFRKCLNPTGRLMAIIGEAPAMTVTLIQPLPENQWETVSVFDTVVPPLLHATEPEKFTF